MYSGDETNKKLLCHSTVDTIIFIENLSCAVVLKQQKTNCVFSLPVQVASVPGLRREGVREIRARYPNFDPEIGSVIDGQIHVHDGTLRNY
jgi:hypothetical protein